MSRNVLMPVVSVLAMGCATVPHRPGATGSVALARLVNAVVAQKVKLSCSGCFENGTSFVAAFLADYLPPNAVMIQE